MVSEVTGVENKGEGDKLTNGSKLYLNKMSILWCYSTE